MDPGALKAGARAGGLKPLAPLRPLPSFSNAVSSAPGDAPEEVMGKHSKSLKMRRRVGQAKKKAREKRKAQAKATGGRR